jgi:serine protease inhibitor
MKKKIISLMLSLLVMSACTTSSITNLSHTTGSLTLSQVSDIDPDLVKNINELAFKLQGSSEKNVFLSSLSIYLALAMTSHGTDNASYDQFMSLLNPSGLDETTWLAQLRALQGNLNASTPVMISLSNSLWMKDSFKDQVKEDFLSRNKEYFGAFIAALDFSKPSSLDEINGWVKKNTNKLIDKVLQEIDPATVMILINTIYFKGDWSSKFDKEDTKDGIFHGITEETVKFMNQTGAFPYFEDDQLQSILLPYEGNKMGMLIVLGKDNTNPLSSNDQFISILDALQNSSVSLKMPKVDIATSMKLNDSLIALGLSDPFDSNLADFSRLAQADLYIGKVLHKARLIVDEEGIEAAAATTVIIDVTSIPTSDHEMVVDHPFQVFIVDLENKMILFNGSINDVNASE